MPSHTLLTNINYLSISSMGLITWDRDILHMSPLCRCMAAPNMDQCLMLRLMAQTTIG